MREYAKGRYTVTNELAIYDKLLSFEEERLRSRAPQRRVTVTTNVEEHAGGSVIGGGAIVGGSSMSRSYSSESRTSMHAGGTTTTRYSTTRDSGSFS